MYSAVSTNIGAKCVKTVALVLLFCCVLGAGFGVWGFSAVGSRISGL